MNLVTWPLRKIWGGVTRTGRIVLWIAFWPVGLWRSIAHGQKKRARALERELRRQQRV